MNVWSTPETRHSSTSIRNLPIDTPEGGHVRLDDVADVRIVPTPNVIKRETVSRRIDVTANVGERDLGSIVADVRTRLGQLELPRGYSVQLLGESAERQAAQGRLALYAAGCRDRDLPPPPGGLRKLAVGASSSSSPCRWLWWAASLAAYLSGGTISLGSLVGFLTVFGIAARNGILLINHYQHLEREEGETFGSALVLRGALERISPILMTALATGLALVPLVALGNIPGHEIEYPMAIVILGGLVTSTAAQPLPRARSLPAVRAGSEPHPPRELVSVRCMGASALRPSRATARYHRRPCARSDADALCSRLRIISWTWPT